MTFDQWYSKLVRMAKSKDRLGMIENKEAYRDYYEDGFDPADVLRCDQEVEDEE